MEKLLLKHDQYILVLQMFCISYKHFMVILGTLPLNIVTCLLNKNDSVYQR